LVADEHVEKPAGHATQAPPTKEYPTEQLDNDTAKSHATVLDAQETQAAAPLR